MRRKKFVEKKKRKNVIMIEKVRRLGVKLYVQKNKSENGVHSDVWEYECINHRLSNEGI